jgi:hypothetical protein
MTEAIDWKRLDGALSLGLSRQPLPRLAGAEALDEPARALAALALLGQRTRLAPAAPPRDQTDASRLPDDPRPMLEPAAREALLRLDRRLDAEGRRLLAPMILAALADAERRLHVFDLPSLETLLRSGGKALGPVERAWLGWTAGGAVDQPGGPSSRLDALRQARRADPAAARETLVASLAGEPAKLRAELIQGLDVGLGPGDATFLESCLADRALGVRDAATLLLARLPGAPAYEDRLALARACLGAETKGLLRKTRRLTFKPSGDRHAMETLFEGFRLSDLVADLGFTRADLPEAAVGAQAVLPLLARAALLDDDPALASAFLVRIEDAAWPGDVLDLSLNAELLALEARHAVLDGALSPEARFDPLRHGFRLAGFLNGPMRPALFARLIVGPAWRRWLKDLSDWLAADDRADGDVHLLPAVVAAPPSMARQVADALAAIPAARRPKTDAWLAFLAQLATAPSNPSAPSETPVV